MRHLFSQSGATHKENLHLGKGGGGGGEGGGGGVDI